MLTGTPPEHRCVPDATPSQPSLRNATVRLGLWSFPRSPEHAGCAYTCDAGSNADMTSASSTLASRTLISTHTVHHLPNPRTLAQSEQHSQHIGGRLRQRHFCASLHVIAVVVDAI